jgi:mRNA-degrading endonuclease toxin of MazEF toxin-antitoxin module
MAGGYAPGDILLAGLVFTSQTGAKQRPVMVIRDAGDDDMLVVPVTGQAAGVAYDVVLSDWQQAGLADAFEDRDASGDSSSYRVRVAPDEKWRHNSRQSSLLSGPRGPMLATRCGVSSADRIPSSASDSSWVPPLRKDR